MFKKLHVCLIVALAAIVFIGCATPTPKGILYTNCYGPTYGTNNEKSTKTGEAAAYSVLGLVGWGDASVKKASENGKIQKIHHVDYNEMIVFLGVFTRYKTIVHGD